eukprot:1157615-Pelagomonas_calceolata.AAC.1
MEKGGQHVTLGSPCAGISVWEMAEILYLINHWVLSLHLFCNDVPLIQRLQVPQLVQDML